MLDVLERALKELPELVQDFTIWESFQAGTYEAVYTPFNFFGDGCFITLRKLISEEAIYHLQPFASLICEGSCEVKIETTKSNIAKFILSSGSKYEIEPKENKVVHSFQAMDGPVYQIVVSEYAWHDYSRKLSDIEFQSLMANFDSYFQTGFMGDKLDDAIDRTLNDGELRHQFAKVLAGKLRIDNKGRWNKPPFA